MDATAGGSYGMNFDPSASELARIRISLRPAAASVAVARRTVDEFLADESASDLLANLKLVVSELVTNAIRHTSTEDEIQLSLTRYLKHVHVSVLNRGSLFDLKRFRRGRSEGGLGLERSATMALHSAGSGSTPLARSRRTASPVLTPLRGRPTLWDSIQLRASSTAGHSRGTR
jgi:anti-sigma regulatory factor (Ser/Thr protein kinase)